MRTIHGISSTSMTRRQVMTAAAATGVGVAVAAGFFPAPAVAQNRAPYALPPLPYAENALEPVISARTVGIHYGAHHRGYVETINRLVQGDPLGDLPLEELIRTTNANPNRAAHFNNAAQVWNHTFYWNSLKPNGGRQPTGALKAKIDEDLGGYDRFKADFAAISNGQFGSGWGWLIADDKGKLSLTRTPNAETPMARGQACLLTIDVWEHAYYLDYQNRRPEYTAAVIDRLLNWDFANEQYDKAKKG